MLYEGILLTQDPIGLAGGTNLYAYAGNNPVAWSDPFGLAPAVVDTPPRGLSLAGTLLLAAPTSGPAAPLLLAAAGAVGAYVVVEQAKPGSSIRRLLTKIGMIFVGAAGATSDTKSGPGIDGVNAPPVDQVIPRPPRPDPQPDDSTTKRPPAPELPTGGG